MDTLKELRNQACQSSKGGFSLQSQQKFLRRVLSPDSPTRNLLMVHGTGSGKTCTAIQIAEEYILRPEFQDKKVMVIASRAVQENFQTQIFDMSRVNLDATQTTLSSKQCTGRRYLDMLLRIEATPRNWNDPDIRSRLEKTADKMINEFYEFGAYGAFGNLINERLLGPEPSIDKKWIHENFDNRLLIIDEAHNIREDTGTTGVKGITQGLEKLVKYADGLVLVLLTGTPMFDSYEEIVYFMNLFLWNDRKQPFDKRLTPAEFFKDDGTLKPDNEEQFRTWAGQYVSYVKGDNPFTFPFRLPPPNRAADDVEIGFGGSSKITEKERFKYLSLVASELQGEQKELVGDKSAMIPTIAVFPEDKDFRSTFVNAGNDQLAYVDKDLPFLKPEHLGNYSAKFASVIRSIEKSEGIVLVYSNYKTMGSQLFAMALEEAGYDPAIGNTLLVGSGGKRGKYMLLSEKMTDVAFNTMMQTVKSENNKDGDKIRVVITSPVGAEGIDFRFIRQVHILDPWWNMSRIEQVIGRALRTCSHQLLPFEKQNCSVYLHVVRSGKKECFDENTYRTKVEEKAIKIAKVRRVLEESAMDCPLQNKVNTLPQDWKELKIQQTRAEDNESVSFTLEHVIAPTFSEMGDVTQCKVTPGTKDPEHTRPLSAYLDARDEIINKLSALFVDKPIWDRTELFAAFPNTAKDVVVYTIQNAITGGFQFHDAFGRPSLLESKGELYALAPIGLPNSTLIERSTQRPTHAAVNIPRIEKQPETAAPVGEALDLDALIKLPKPFTDRFSPEILRKYVFDHLLTKPQKRDYLRAHPDFQPSLKIPGTDILVLGDGVFDPPEEPIGDEKDRYVEWTRQLIQRFTANKTMLYGSLTEDGKFTLSKMNADGTRNINKTDKSFKPTICGTGASNKKTLEPLSKTIDKLGIGLPPEVKGSDWCAYIELLIREGHNSIWILPEELSVLFSKENTKKVNSEFKK